jgi:hypothetical protein
MAESRPDWYYVPGSGCQTRRCDDAPIWPGDFFGNPYYGHRFPLPPGPCYWFETSISYSHHCVGF